MFNIDDILEELKLHNDVKKGESKFVKKIGKSLSKDDSLKTPQAVSGFVVFEIEKNCDNPREKKILEYYLKRGDPLYSITYSDMDMVTRVIKKNGYIQNVVCIVDDLNDFEKGIEYVSYDAVDGFFLVENMFGERVLCLRNNFNLTDIPLYPKTGIGVKPALDISFPFESTKAKEYKTMSYELPTAFAKEEKEVDMVDLFKRTVMNVPKLVDDDETKFKIRRR